MTDLTARQAILAFLGHEPVPADVLRAAVVQLLYGYDAIVDLAADATSIDDPAAALSDLTFELLAQQEILEEYTTSVCISTALPELCRSRRSSRSLSPGEHAHDACADGIQSTSSEDRFHSPTPSTLSVPGCATPRAGAFLFLEVVMAAKDGFDFDPAAIERQFRSLERDVLPKAQAGLLNGLAFRAQKSLLKYAETTIQGGPTPFTKRAFVVDKAIPSAATMAAVVKVQPTQARYLQYLINGGKRQAGDPGAGQYDVLVDGTDKTAFGNLRRGFVKKIALQAKAEKTKRARLRAQRDKAREAGKSVNKYSWKVKGANSAGTFFGEINGLRGYLMRSKTDVKKAAFLARFSDSAEYEKTFLWDKEIGAAIFLYNPSKAYAHELQRSMPKLKK